MQEGFTPATHAPPPRPRPAERVRQVCAALITAALLVTAIGLAAPTPADAKAPSRAAQRTFMWAMAGQESGWNYRARNRSSGAYGKYQIMPSNWPSWAATYIGNRRAAQTPRNQERVAYGKIRGLHRWLGSWRRVAYWWLTGGTTRDERRWSSTARGYVNRVMSLRARAPRSARAEPLASVRRTRAPARGDWRRIRSDLRLRLAPAGRAWPRNGRLERGVTVRIAKADRTRNKGRWLRVVTRAGRIGWVKQSRTAATRQPARPRLWSDVRSAGRR